MNNYKVKLLYISELGQQIDLFIEFNQSANLATEKIEYLAISLGYQQLITEGFNLTPDDQDYFFFEKIKSLQMV